ncbi:MAG: ligase-associated DNA damage response exonuclease [Phycisphaerales bacterium]
MAPPLLQADERGLACASGGFHIDPWGAADIAVITHAHGDHARSGSRLYICSRESEKLLRVRLGPEPRIESLEYGEPRDLDRVRISLHPAGHVRGSAQVRVESSVGVWIAAGDYKRARDPTCSGFQVVPCDVFITETTFALPIYRWRPTDAVISEIAAWWRENAAREHVSVLFSYSLGKAQRLLAELARHFGPAGAPGEVFTHGALEPLLSVYRADGIAMLPTRHVAEEAKGTKRKSFAGQLVVAPPSAAGSTWMRRFGPGDRVGTAFVSGWMQIRGIRRRRGYDRGFVLSDHADWPDLLRTIRETGAKRVLCTHGYSETMSKYLRERGLDADVLRLQYAGEEAED